MSLLTQKFKFLRKAEKSQSGHQQIEQGGREWESFYRDRWSYDKTVRTTHGVNCTGSCSWNVYVKNGIVAWENQATDYPATPDDMPDYEPRGCARGSTFSWYLYSPSRVKYPYMRGVLADFWRKARKEHATAIEAWKSIVTDPVKRTSYTSQRGMGGFVRSTWEEVSEVIAASMLYTAQTYGPDRNFGFSVIPAMSQLSYAAGTRFLNLMGGVPLSFYDWYADLPPASPQVWGEQTDSPESGDWFNAGYIITWGSNVPLTRTPDAHFMNEVRYKGTKVVSVSPDYAESTTSADAWLNVKAGTDAALAMAMGHVILKEYYLDRKVSYFQDYAKQFTDMPFFLRVEEDTHGHVVPTRFLNAADCGRTEQDAEFKGYIFDANSQSLVTPNGTMGERHANPSKWNLRLEDSQTGKPIDPVLSVMDMKDEVVSVQLPYFGEDKEEGFVTHNIPVMTVQTTAGPVKVTTVYDLIMAHYGLDRGLGGEVATSYEDDIAYTPAWQEKFTGVSPALAIQTAREFADTAEATKGRSMVIMGAGINHWYHADIIYRAILNIIMFTGTEGKNGGGWAHYVGQEKLRPAEGWGLIMTAKDWGTAPRLQNSPSFFYFATEQFRSDVIDINERASKLATPRYAHPGDYNVMAARLGWLPSYPTFDRGSQQLVDEAKAQGATTADEINAYIVDQLKAKQLNFSVQDPGKEANFPRNLFVWRANLIGSSSKGHEYFLKYLLGTKNGVIEDSDAAVKPEEIKWRDQEVQGGKLDLLIDLDFRMASTGLYSDIVLPAATWYEKDDLSSTDMHPFLHVFQPAVNPGWEAKSDWDIFRTLAEAVSKVAKESNLLKYQDIVAVPLQHDTRGELATPNGEVKDWYHGECEPVPGKTMPNLVHVERDFTKIYEKFIGLGPGASKKAGAHGATWDISDEYEALKEQIGTIDHAGYVSNGCPSIFTAKQACDATLRLSSCSNGKLAVRGWEAVEKQTGLDNLQYIAKPREGQRFTFDECVIQPRNVISSPTSTAKSDNNRRYSPFNTSIDDLFPFRTVTGRQSYYLDHEMVRDFGEGLALFKPTLNYAPVKGNYEAEGQKSIKLKYLTPHNKWSTHSMYFDAQQMLTLFRGGQTVWLNEDDAAEIGVADNDWVEAYNKNGVVAARAVVSPRIPRGIMYMHHAQDRHINVPGAPISKERGGTHNAPTHIHLKPTHMIGGYGQLSYGFNYYGPTGNQRDMVVVVRKIEEVDWLED